MNKEQLYEYINLFREKSQNGKLIVFVGSGVSRNVDKMPSWSGLVKEMAEEIGYSKCKNCNNAVNCTNRCSLADELSIDEFLKIPQYLFNANPSKYDEILKRNIHHPKVNAPLSDVIFDMNPVHIITTNYDHLLEDSENEFREQYQVIVRDKDLLESDKSKYIIKMHGDIDDPNTIVLREENYLNYSQDHVLIELFVKSLLVDHTILFLGYSLNDYNIKLIISWLNFMRTQNNTAMSKDARIGYIVLDEDEVEDLQIRYFGKNNIEVINIHKMPIENGIPTDLTSGKGQRLYSFIKTISVPSIEENITFMLQHKYINFNLLLKSIAIKNYAIFNSILQLFEEKDYEKMESLINKRNPLSKKIKKMLATAGITQIGLISKFPFKSIEIGKPTDSALYDKPLFDLYLNNKFDELYIALERGNISLAEKCFYASIIQNYSKAAENFHAINFADLTTDEKVAYLHNESVLNLLSTYKFDADKTEKYIKNLPLSREREFYSTYTDIYKGNPEVLFKIKTALDKLKKAINNKYSVSIGSPAYKDIFLIRSYAYSLYNFYFLNNLFWAGFDDLKKFLLPYIEGIICANSEMAAVPSTLFNTKVENSKYPIEILDVEIISKFISSEDLQKLFITYKINGLNISIENIKFLENCFVNLTKYIIKYHEYGIRNYLIDTISNISFLLSVVEVNNYDENAVIEAATMLFLDKDLCSFLFSVELRQWKNYVRSFSKLFSKLHIPSNFAVIQNIISAHGCMACLSTNLGLIRNIVLAFVNKENFKTIESQVIGMIENAETINDKLLLLHIFFRLISNKEFKEQTTSFLIENFNALDGIDIFEFMDGDWIKFSNENVNQLFDDIIALAKHNNIIGLKCFPDAVENQLFKIYILYLENIIDDVSRLSQLAENYPHLQFLIYPDNFDYSQVDFTNYMWKNFARYKKTRAHFIAHKEPIVKKLKEKLKTGVISESEKEILYRFFSL